MGSNRCDIRQFRGIAPTIPGMQNISPSERVRLTPQGEERIVLRTCLPNGRRAGGIGALPLLARSINTLTCRYT